MAIPLYILLLVYGFFLIMFFLFLFINIGHLTKTGTFTLGSMVVTAIVCLLTTTILLFTWNALQEVNWTKDTITLFENSGTALFKSQSLF